MAPLPLQLAEMQVEAEGLLGLQRPSLAEQPAKPQPLQQAATQGEAATGSNTGRGGRACTSSPSAAFCLPVH